MTETVDCAIVGGGPAGLTAALYLARFRRTVVVLDRGGSRAALIPASHNLAGFTGGVSGRELLVRIAEQARQYGAELRDGDVTSLALEAGGWRLRGEGFDLQAKAALIATGVDNRGLDLPRDLHQRALDAGQLRYCPICDGYEAGGPANDRRIGVVGAHSRGVAEALFLRTYSPNVTLFTREQCELHEKDRAELERAGVGWDPRPVEEYDFTGPAVRLRFTDGEGAEVDTLYPALGSEPNIELIRRLALRTDDEDCIIVDQHQRLGLNGLYAAGDVVASLDQIAVAIGQAAIAATAIHNDLRERTGEAPA